MRVICRFKLLTIIVLSFFVLSVKGQVYQEMPQYGYRANRMVFDSTLSIPTVCGVPTLKSNILKKAAIAFDSCNGVFYQYNPKTLAWSQITGGGGGGSIDTTSLSNRINLKLNISDTSTMLSKYLRKIDTTNKFVNNITRTPGKDSIIFYVGSNRYAIKDSIGTGGGGGGGTPANPNLGIQYNSSGSFAASDELKFQSNNLNIGNSSLNNGKITILKTTTDATNTNGENTHLLLQNDHTYGQNSIYSKINGNPVFKLRTDYQGNSNYISYDGSHKFYMGGDYPNGKIGMTIKNNGDFSIGDSLNWKINNDSIKMNIYGLTKSNSNYILSYDSLSGKLGYIKNTGGIDTTSLSNRINLKLNITDTTNKWVNSVTKLNDSTIRVIKGTSTSDITLTPSTTIANATRLVTTVYNNTGSTITKGSVIYINGRHSSNYPTIALAQEIGRAHV
mgnify:CR=1 FL=1